MQTTPSFLPIPSNGHSSPHTPRGSYPRQPSFDLSQPGPSRYVDGSVATTSGLSTMMQNYSPPPSHASPSSNPHSGFHPSSFGGPLSFSALALGAVQGSSPYSSSMAMSISPPRWAPGSMGGGGFTSGSFVGSVGALGTSFGRQAEGRERELEAKYVKDFTCCGRQLSGLHELLEHYEEEHANLAPDVRLAAINAAQNQPPVTAALAKRSFVPSIGAMGHGDAPTTPGMMDMDMDDPTPAAPVSLMQQPSVASLTVNLQPGATPPWSAAFRNINTNMQPPACVPPSVLSYTPGTSTPPQRTQQQQQQHQQHQQQLQQQRQQQQQQQQQQHLQQQRQQQQHLQQQHSGSPQNPAISQAAMAQQMASSPTPDQIAQAKLIKKAQKKVEKSKAEEEEDSHDPPGERRFRCPIEGCGKVYKQANGLKYHLTRSINSGHGNVAAMGGLMALLDESKE